MVAMVVKCHWPRSRRTLTVNSSSRNSSSSSRKPAAAIIMPTMAAAVAASAKPNKIMTNPLEALGSSLRNRDDPYIDVSALHIPTSAAAETSVDAAGAGAGAAGTASTTTSSSSSSSSLPTRRTRGGVAEPFPERLHRMLTTCEHEAGDNGSSSAIVSFFSHGRAFGVHDMDRFVQELMPQYFKQSKCTLILIVRSI
jgi:HSF-type DNA-binding